MKAYTILNAVNREVGKKSITKKLLKSGFVPAVIYIKGGDNACISLSSKEVVSVVNDPSALTRIYEVKLEGKSYNCIIKEVQFNPVKDTPRSIDFMEVKEGDIVKVKVPIRILNKDICPGVKNGGDVYRLTYSVELKCKVEKIPYAIEIDVKDCNVGAKFFLRDIKLPEDCQMIKDIILIRVAGKRVIKETEIENATEATATETTAENATANATATAEK